MAAHMQHGSAAQGREEQLSSAGKDTQQSGAAAGGGKAAARASALQSPTEPIVARCGMHAFRIAAGVAIGAAGAALPSVEHRGGAQGRARAYRSEATADARAVAPGGPRRGTSPSIDQLTTAARRQPTGCAACHIASSLGAGQRRARALTVVDGPSALRDSQTAVCGRTIDR